MLPTYTPSTSQPQQTPTNQEGGGGGGVTPLPAGWGCHELTSASIPRWSLGTGLSSVGRMPQRQVEGAPSPHPAPFHLTPMSGRHPHVLGWVG